MAGKRTLLTVTMTAEEWHHVLGVLRAGARHLEPAADAVGDAFSAAFRRAVLDGLSAAEVDELADALGTHDGPATL